MKNNILKLIPVAVFLFCCAAVSAQQVTDKKTNPGISLIKQDEVKMQSPPLPLKIAQEENAETKILPVKPGGEFKPMETGDIKLTEMETQKYYNHIPIILTQSTTLPAAAVEKPVLNTATTPGQKSKPLLPLVKQQ